MFTKTQPERSSTLMVSNPFRMLDQMALNLDRILDQSAFPTLRTLGAADKATWAPDIEVFEKDKRLVARVDLPGMKKEDVTVEVADGRLVISGERKSEKEEKGKYFYRSEREYGSFYRAVPLPDGVALADTKATFADGVLEVSVPLPVAAETKAKKIDIQEPAKAVKPAA